MLPIDLESIGFLGDFCSTEIALEGLKGKHLKQDTFWLFDKPVNVLIKVVK